MLWDATCGTDLPWLRADVLGVMSLHKQTAGTGARPDRRGGTETTAQHGATGLLASLPPRLLPMGPGMTLRPSARTAHRHHPVLRRALAVGLLVLLTWGATGCGDPDDDGGGGGGGYVAQQASAAPRPH